MEQPDIRIDWPKEHDPIQSAKDTVAPFLKTFKALLF